MIPEVHSIAIEGIAIPAKSPRIPCTTATPTTATAKPCQAPARDAVIATAAKKIAKGTV